MTDPRDGKYKGTKGQNPRSGLGRLRRAASKNQKRVGGWERGSEDDQFLESHAQVQRPSHTGERLLSKFNRLAGESSAVGGIAGEVCGFNGPLLLVRDASGAETPCQLKQILKKKVSGVKNPLCVGDLVRFERGEPEGMIIGIEPRRNQLARADSHNRALLHVLAANVDRLVVVAAITQPELKPGFIDRYLLIAHANDIPPVVVFNKCDLADAAAIAEVYRKLDYPVFMTSTVRKDGEIDGLREHLRGTHTMFAGQSGVGKSSLINALFPDLGAKVAAVSAASGLGRHTTTSSRSYPLEHGGSLIDTPGIRECGISGMTPLDVALLYRDMAAWHHQCRFNNCTHTHEPECAVIAAVERGEIAISRYQSYCSILDEDLAGESPA